MASAPPIPCLFANDVFTPLDRFLKVAHEHYGEGEVVSLVQHEDASGRSRGHYFATLHDLFQSLPEDETERFPTEEHLRKYALIKTGYRDERTIACASRAEALRFAAFVKPMDEYAVVTVSEAVVRVWTAKSQKRAAMGNEMFQRSKADVLGFVSEMIGVPA